MGMAGPWDRFFMLRSQTRSIFNAHSTWNVNSCGGMIRGLIMLWGGYSPFRKQIYAQKRITFTVRSSQTVRILQVWCGHPSSPTTRKQITLRSSHMKTPQTPSPLCTLGRSCSLDGGGHRKCGNAARKAQNVRIIIGVCLWESDLAISFRNTSQ